MTMVNLAFDLMSRIIARGAAAGTLDRADIMNKLDVFLAADRITAAQYQELSARMNDEGGDA